MVARGEGEVFLKIFHSGKTVNSWVQVKHSSLKRNFENHHNKQLGKPQPVSNSAAQYPELIKI